MQADLIDCPRTLQFIGFQHAAWLALHLNRTLVLPPITSNRHDNAFTFQKWSTYFDIPRFEQLTGLQVKEWADIKPMTEKEIAIGIDRARHPHSTALPEWESLAENITCQITKDFDNLDGTPGIFARLFLLRVAFVDPPPPPLSHRESKNTTSANATVLDANSTSKQEMVALSDIRDRYQYSEDISLYFSHTYGLKGAAKIRPFDEIGRLIYFRRDIVDLARQMVQALDPKETAKSSPRAPLSSSSSSASSPSISTASSSSSIDLPSPTPSSSLSVNATRPYIAIHFRRDDIIFKCIDRQTHKAHTPIQQCMPSMKRWVAAVEKARQRLKLRTTIEPLVVVMTDTTSKEDLDAIKANGWHHMDHVKAGTRERLGIFGAAMVDAAILTYADELVGTQVSTMSQVAQARRRSWFGRDTLYP
ncbi:hypothetical protein BGZ68_001601 [Mortierella alpina]|nr:hypothetical protein BGZ68_001601 [Mortierella alpina]